MYFWSSIMCEDGVKDGMLSWDRQCDGSTYVYSKRSKQITCDECMDCRIPRSYTMSVYWSHKSAEWSKLRLGKSLTWKVSNFSVENTSETC